MLVPDMPITLSASDSCAANPGCQVQALACHLSLYTSAEAQDRPPRERSTQFQLTARYVFSITAMNDPRGPREAVARGWNELPGQ